jgi:5-formyltetrahydrofolate cyclo-ligase
MEDLQAIPSQKRELRREMMAQRDALPERDERSARICARVIATELFAQAAAIHCFLPMRSEVDTRPIIAAALAAAKAVAIPITVKNGPLEHAWITSLDPEAFEPGVFGTLRPRTLVPAAPGDWALTIVPLLAFDRSCYRIGYGKGYYDQLLTQTRGPAVGVAFAAQERPGIPREPHDVPLDMVVTEDRYIRRP